MTEGKAPRIGFVFYGYCDSASGVNVAGWTRVTTLARLFAANGADCRILALTKGAPEEFAFEGGRVHTVSTARGPLSRRVALGFRVARAAADLDLDAVLYVSAFSRVVLPMWATLSRRRQRPAQGVIANDWYTRGTTRLVTWLDAEIAWRYLYPRTGNVLAISEAFVSVFQRQGTPNIALVPSVIDVAEYTPKLAPPDGPVTFCYAGNLKFSGRRHHQKDLVANFHVATAMLAEDDRRRVRLKIMGTSKEDYLETLAKLFPGFDPQTGCRVEYTGFLTGEPLREGIRQSHFSILFRPDLPYARFGSSQKFCESMALGVPVFTNLTGDMGKYLTDGREGIVSADESPQAIAAALRRLLMVPEEGLHRMRRLARQRAERSFDASRHTELVGEFMSRMLP